MGNTKQEFKCPDCKGKGEYDVYSDTIKDNYPVKCQTCNGAGVVNRSTFYYLHSQRRKRAK